MINTLSLERSFLKLVKRATLLDGEGFEAEMESLNKSLGKVRGFGNRSDFLNFENVYQMEKLLLGICCRAGVVSLTYLYFLVLT